MNETPSFYTLAKILMDAFEAHLEFESPRFGIDGVYTYHGISPKNEPKIIEALNDIKHMARNMADGTYTWTYPPYPSLGFKCTYSVNFGRLLTLNIFGESVGGNVKVDALLINPDNGLFQFNITIKTEPMPGVKEVYKYSTR